MTVSGLGYAAALALAGLFAVAAVGKLRDPEGTVESFRGLGVPAARPVGRALPWVELATVLCLAVVPWFGGLVALVMLGFFTTFLVARLRADTLAPCNCFGELGRGPLSWLAVARNGWFMVLAALAVAAGSPTVPTVAEMAVVVVATFAVLTGLVAAGNRAAAPAPDSDRH